MPELKVLDVLPSTAGKLGHGDTNRVYKPKVVEALQGMFIRKVCAGSQSSLALTSTGQVWPSFWNQPQQRRHCQLCMGRGLELGERAVALLEF